MHAVRGQRGFLLSTKSTRLPQKISSKRVRDRESMLMKGGNSGAHKAGQEEEGCIRGETQGGGREPSSGARGDDRGGTFV